MPLQLQLAEVLAVVGKVLLVVLGEEDAAVGQGDGGPFGRAAGLQQDAGHLLGIPIPLAAITLSKSPRVGSFGALGWAASNSRPARIMKKVSRTRMEFCNTSDLLEKDDCSLERQENK